MIFSSAIHSIKTMQIKKLVEMVHLIPDLNNV